MSSELQNTLRNVEAIYKYELVQQFPFLVPVLAAKAKLWSQNSMMQEADFRNSPEVIFALADHEKIEAREAPAGILKAAEYADVGVFDAAIVVKDLYAITHNKPRLTISQKTRLIEDFNMVYEGVRSNGQADVGNFIASVILSKVMGNYLPPYFPKPPVGAEAKASISVYNTGRDKAREFRNLVKSEKKYSDVFGIPPEYKIVFRANGRTPERLLKAKGVALKGLEAVSETYAKNFPDDVTTLLYGWMVTYAPGMVAEIPLLKG